MLFVVVVVVDAVVAGLSPAADLPLVAEEQELEQHSVGRGMQCLRHQSLEGHLL